MSLSEREMQQLLRDVVHFVQLGNEYGVFGLQSSRSPKCRRISAEKSVRESFSIVARRRDMRSKQRCSSASIAAGPAPSKSMNASTSPAQDSLVGALKVDHQLGNSVGEQEMTDSSLEEILRNRRSTIRSARPLPPPHTQDPQQQRIRLVTHHEADRTPNSKRFDRFL